MDICKFLDESYTCYHAVANVCKILEEKGFEKLELGQSWKLKVGGSYFVTQNGSSVVAFKVGANKVFNICESHTDSPSFKIKGGSIVSGSGVQRLNTEKYGGGLLYSFFDRPLKIAGRVFEEREKGVCGKLVVSNYNVVIPSLAIHHNPTANDGFAINLQSDTLPLFSQSQTNLYQTLSDKNVVDADLYVVPATQSFFAGADNEFLCSPRLDNLVGVYTGICALTETTAQNIAVVACLDNEEIGSGTRQGNPAFINNVLQQIENALEFSCVEKANARQSGMVLSVDNGHAVHPAHPEKSDPQMFVNLNGGVVVKHHPNYATDGLSAAIFKKMLKDGNIATQDYYNRSNVRCGSTLGLATSSNLQMKTCDIGLAQLAMHSACETVGAKDIALLQKAQTLFLSSKLSGDSDCIDIL